MTETTRRALRVLALAAAVVALPAQLWAQQDTPPRDTESSGEAAAGTQGSRSEQDTPANASVNEDDPPSPFDYEASEEISEDLSVSFPVDI